MPAVPELFARLGVHRRRPERWAIIAADGRPMNCLSRLDVVTREQLAIDLAPDLARHGLVLLDDNTIIRAADLADAAIETVRDAIARAQGA